MTTCPGVFAFFALTSLTLLLPALPACAQSRITTLTNTYHSDQSVFPPAATTTLRAFVSLPYSAVVTAASFTVDGAVHAVPPPSQSGDFSYAWDSSGAVNPSEHTVSASVTVQTTYPPATATYSSTDAPPPAQGPYSGIYGDGRAGDFVVADLRLKSLKFNNSLPLTQDAATPVPSPQFTWNPASRSLTTFNPAAYIKGQTVGLTMQVCKPDSTALGTGATMGYTLKLQESPNTTNPSTGQADPALTLFDNTTANPVAPTAFTNPATLTAGTALNGWVAKGGTNCSVLNFYVKFTHVTPSPTWGLVNAYASSPFGNTLYTVLAQPTAPMATPWTRVLDLACNWAARTTNAADAAKAVCNGFYASAKYDPSKPWYTDATTPETFHLLNFLNKTKGSSGTTSGLQGQCNDFSDFLCCLSNSLGAVAIKTQRSSSGFLYDNVTFAPDSYSPKQSGSFAYHQWTSDGTATSGNVFDSAIRSTQMMTTPPVNEPLSQYLSWLAPSITLTALSPATPQIAN